MNLNTGVQIIPIINYDYGFEERAEAVHAAVDSRLCKVNVLWYHGIDNKYRMEVAIVEKNNKIVALYFNSGHGAHGAWKQLTDGCQGEISLGEWFTMEEAGRCPKEYRDIEDYGDIYDLYSDSDEFDF